MKKLKTTIPGVCIWALFITVSCLPAQDIESANWSRFRGPNGQGIAAAASIPLQWKEDDFDWKIQLPGKGNSSPVIWNDTVFVTSAEDKKKILYVTAYHISDGTRVWQNKSQLSDMKLHQFNSRATSTPAVDKDHLYVVSFSKADTKLIAFDHRGNQIWRSAFDGIHTRHGAGSSPIVYDGVVIFTREQELNTEVKSTWVGVDAETGKTRWQIERETVESNSMSTPCILFEGENPCILFTSEAHGYTGVDPHTGKILWEFKNAFDARAITSPIYSGGICIASCKEKSVAIQLSDMQNNKFKPLYEFSARFSPYLSTPVVKDDLLFNFKENGTVSCMNFHTGKLIWKERPGGKFNGSPVLVNDMLYCITVEGKVVVLKASDEYQLLAVNPVGEGSFASPAVSGNRIIFRTASNLVCVSGK